MGEIHELFVLALSLVWFAGATPENFKILKHFVNLWALRERFCDNYRAISPIEGETLPSDTKLLRK